MLTKFVFTLPLLAATSFLWLVVLPNQPTDDDVDGKAVRPSSLYIRPASRLSAPVSVVEAPKIKTVNAFPNLTFEAPVEFTYAVDGTNRLYVVEQAGRIKSFENNRSAKSAVQVLDIRKRVSYGGEMGLLGLAFHPKFKENGFFYVNYTKPSPLETVVSRFKMTNGIADPNSEVILLKFGQPYENHNGGKVAFGPDGYLYTSTGDGGSGGDPKNNGQNKSVWLGKILRIDVNGTEKGHYSIPADNPFKGNSEGFREEIYAYGLRNPWRFSFDAKTGQLWTGDVGQNKIEEIDIVTKGGNYGWRIREARDAYDSKQKAEPAATLIDPIHEYAHGDDGNSITGGFVYRGTSSPALAGKYIYGDFGSGRIWALSYTGTKETANQLLLDRAASISAFGEDQQHELYVCDYGTGKILKIEAQ